MSLSNNQRVMRDPTNEHQRTDDIDEYIEYLHDRIEFLENELKAREQTVVEMQTQPAATKREDVEQVGRYIDFLETTYEYDDDYVAAIADGLEAKIEARIVTNNDDFHHVTLALWQLIKEHEVTARTD